MQMIAHGAGICTHCALRTTLIGERAFNNGNIWQALFMRRPGLVRNCARGAGTHTPRPLFEARGQTPFTTRRPVAMGPGLRRDDDYPKTLSSAALYVA